MDHQGFDIINALEGNQGVRPKGFPKKKSAKELKRLEIEAKEQAELAKQSEADKVAAEINKIWLSPFNDAIWHSIGGNE